MTKTIPALIVAIITSLIVHATPYADSSQKYRIDPVSKGLTDISSNRSFQELEKYFANTESKTPTGVGYTTNYFEEFNEAGSNSTIEQLKGMAKTAISEIESSNNYVDYLEPSDLNKLPIGLKKKVGNSEVTVAISSVTFTSKYAELTVFARINIPQAPYQIFFGVQGVKLSHKGGIIGEGKLVLLGDVAIPINGNNAALILKGGMDLTTGLSSDLTYVKIDCNGFKELKLSADVQFPRSLLIPCSITGDTLSTGLVKVGFSTTVRNWNDIIVSDLRIPTFQIAGLNGITFDIKNAAFDLSDYQNSNSILFPAGYQDKYLVPGNASLWRGVYAKSLTVILPKAFKDRTTTERVSFGVQDLIIDNNGITGVFFAQNVLPISKGSASGWKFSVDSIRIALEANHLTRAGFGGKIALPITKGTDDANAKNKLLEYSAIITPNSGYVCRVITKDSLDFDVWMAKVVLLPNSYIQLAGNENGLKPEAMLHGSMGIVARNYGNDTTGNNDASKKPVADLKGIEFQSLHITTNPPYVTAQYFGYRGEVKVANFPVSFSSIALETLSSTESALAFDLKLNFHENEFGGETRLQIVGKLETNEGLQSWKYNRLSIADVRLYADVKDAFRLDGYLAFLKNDPIYGDGFKGSIKANFKKGLDLEVGVTAIFGKKEFRYWFVDGMLKLPGTGIPTPIGININGFAGGAYYRMKKSFATATAPSGADYTPDETAGLGVMAGVLFNWGAEKVANGRVSFEMAFNRGGGIRYIGLFGLVKIMEEMVPKDVDLGSFTKNQFKEIAQKSESSSTDADALNQQKVLQPSEAAKKVVEVSFSDQPGTSGISAYLGIQYDFAAKTLHGNFDVYINTAGGLLRGIGTNNRAGWAVVHFASKNDWYVHMGTPTDRMGVRFGIGSFNISTGTYFMVGHRIPKFPDPPKPVIDILGSKGSSYNNNISNGDLEQGKGFAFGTSVSVSTGDIRFLMFYANLQAGLGFDVMLKDMSNYTCAGQTGKPGINGWFAQGQAYAYLQGELGVRIKIGPVKKNISIMKAGAAALLQAKLPNPTWVGGAFGIQASILGGKIKVNATMELSFGTKCEFVKDINTDSTNWSDFVVVSSIDPSHQTTNVSVLGSAKVNFSIKPGQALDIDSENGASSIYPQLEYARIVEKTSSGDVEIPVRTEYSNNGETLVLIPNAMLKGQTTYKVQTKVYFMEYKYGNWAPISENGVRAEEIKEQTFTTGRMPDSIDHSWVTRMYPFFNQRNLYKNETEVGGVSFNTDISSMLTGYQSWSVRFKTANGQVYTSAPASYNQGERKFNITLPANLATGTTYKMELIGDKGTTDPVKPILTIHFTTSQYNTLAQKVQALQTVQPIIGRVSSDIINLQAKVGAYEGFELYELKGNTYTGGVPLVNAEAILDDNYYTQSIKPLLYTAVESHGAPLHDPYSNVTFYLQERYWWTYGLPPAKAVTLSSYYVGALSSGEGMYNEYVKTRLPFVYDLARYYNTDFIDLRNQVINHYLTPTSSTTYTCYGGGGYYDNYSSFQNSYDQSYSMDFDNGGSYCVPQTEMVVQGVPYQFHALVLNPFPFMARGTYKIRIFYKLPDGTPKSTADFNYLNPIY